MPLSVRLEREGNSVQNIFNGEDFAAEIPIVYQHEGSPSECQVYEEQLERPKAESLREKVERWRITEAPYLFVIRVQKGKEGGPLTAVKWHDDKGGYGVIAEGESARTNQDSKLFAGYFDTYAQTDPFGGMAVTNHNHENIEAGEEKEWKIDIAPGTHLIVSFFPKL